MIYNTNKRNYSKTTVTIQPGTVVKDCNFCQEVPGTQGIICDGVLTLRECNLVNCLIDERWIVESCNTAQIIYTVTTTAQEEWSVEEIARLQALSGLLTQEEWAKIEPEILAPAQDVTVATFVCSHPSALGGGS